MRTYLVACVAFALALPSSASGDASDPASREDGASVFQWLVALGKGEAARARLVGHGGQWEQAALSCERPRVALALDAKDDTFELAIESRCRGQSHVANFAGRWAAERDDRLVLTFPEPEGPDETLACAIARCDDGSGEDCVTCSLAPDLSFELKSVRR